MSVKKAVAVSALPGRSVSVCVKIFCVSLLFRPNEYIPLFSATFLMLGGTTEVLSVVYSLTIFCSCRQRIAVGRAAAVSAGSALIACR